MENKILYIFMMLISLSCSSGGGKGSGTIAILLDFQRIDQPGLDPFIVKAAVTDSGNPVIGASVSLTVPKGSVSPITDNGDGSYAFTITPAVTGVYPVTVSYSTASIRRDALVVTELGSGIGQPLLVPGLVNTKGYEDGITITPDGEYLFIQYGPIYFSGIANLMTICYDSSYSLYNLFGSTGNSDSNWVFDTIGPYNTPSRPNFPVGAISAGKLSHLNIVVPNVANGIALFPTVFYGFKRQNDGTFAQPFKVAFNDAKGANGPYGLSFKMTSPTTAVFAVAWNNYFSGLGDDKPDIYQGTMTMGQDTNLGDVAYSGDFFSSIAPNISPVSFTSHAGVQGNPHLYYDAGENIISIWTDDEQTSHDLTVYVLTAGIFPTGTWSLVLLPSKINTAQSESQPFFTGTKLYLNREVSIVYHAYTGPHTAAGYSNNANWGPEVVVLKSGVTGVGGIFGVGEPTIAVYNGKTYLYFAAVETRAAGIAAGRYDYNLDAGFVELP